MTNATRSFSIVVRHTVIAGWMAGVLATAIGGCNKAGDREGVSTPSAVPAPASRALSSKSHFPAAHGTDDRPDIEFYEIKIGGSGPGRPMVLNLYLPAGRHDARSLPCVFIAPAGSANHGSVIDDSDRAEHYPYVRARFRRDGV